MQPFLGQLQPYAFNFAPKGWAFCDGQILSIAQSSALFALLGTTYGGNGVQTFALPDLRGRVPVHFGTSQGGENFTLGEIAGSETVSLNITQLPSHQHAFMGSSADATSASAANGSALATAKRGSQTPNNFYGPMSPPQPLNPGSIGPIGGNQAHDNMQPYLTINWSIALQGIFPSRG